MMAWSDKTKPTPANMRKRLKAALDALDAAQTLLLLHPRCASAKMKRASSAISNAIAWAADAEGKLRGPA